MGSPNMAAITASLERSLQNCSLNHQHSPSSSNTGGGGAAHAAASPETPPLDSNNRTLELNSEAALPYHWEQCLDLETGEIYYINWKTGMRSEEDPRTTAAYGGDYYSEEDSSSSYDDSEGSSTESSPYCSREQWSGNSNNNQGICDYEDGKSENESGNSNNNLAVLVVAGCKGCFMYYMVPKHNVICPKCCGQLIHFDRSDNASA